MQEILANPRRSRRFPAHENLLFHSNYLGNYSSLLSHRSFHQNSQLLKFSLLIDYCNYETVQTDVVNKDKSAYHIVACLPDGGLQTPPDSIFENYPSKVAAKNVKPLFKFVHVFGSPHLSASVAVTQG